MKKFLAKCLLLALIVGGILYVGGWAYRQTNTYRNLDIMDNTLKFQEIPSDIDVAVFGSSHGRDAFLFAPEGDVLFNFSLSSQTPQYDEKILCQYKEYIDDDALIFLTISYMSPFWTDPEERFEEKQDRYYRILSAENVVDVNLARYLLQHFSILLTEDITKVISAFLRDEAILGDPTEAAKYTQTDSNEMMDEQERVRRDHYEAVVESIFPEINPVMWEAYHNILRLCQEQGWTAVLVTPPYLAEYHECFPEEFYPVFYEKVNALAEEFGVHYLDYSRDEQFVARYDLFKNIDHLNAYGAEILDEKLYDHLGEIGLL